MTKPKGIFKKRTNKGNRFYKRLPSVSPDEDSTVRPRPTTPNVVVPPSSSEKKLGSSATKYDEFEVLSENIIVDFSLLKAMFDNVACKQCGDSVTLSQNEPDRNGLVSRLSLRCASCDDESFFWTSNKCKDSSMFETNIRFFYGLRCIGKGLEAGKMLCAMLNLPSPSTARRSYTNVTSKAIEVVAEESMANATKIAVEENEKGINENEEKTDLSIAFDGSWQRRGFVYKNGYTTVTSMDTGKVLDVEVMTKFCSGCTKVKSEAQKIAHASLCKKNYEGSRGGMETAAAVTMFGRSLVKRKVRYVNFLGDGDSKAFEEVKSKKPYGDKEIKKLECIGHVMKRMGTRMRKLKQKLGNTPLSDGKPIKGAGRLTDKVIDELQGFYGKAIRDNCDDLQKMKKAVWASYFHKCATDDNHETLHNMCPEAPTTWCKYKLAKAKGEAYKHKNSIPEAVMLAVKPIYQALANPILLSKCLHGKTQNVNESFNNVVWTRIPKKVFVGIDTLAIGVRDAVIVFNDGNVGRLRVLQELGIADIGKNTLTALRRIDAVRLREAERAAEMMTKESRVKKRRRALGEEEENDEHYVPGGF